MNASRLLSWFFAGWLLAWTPGGTATGQARDTVTLRAHVQTVSLYGRRGSRPVVVSSGDGGWVHLAPHVAEFRSISKSGIAACS